jgi:hypothetical protein
MRRDVEAREMRRNDEGVEDEIREQRGQKSKN